MNKKIVRLNEGQLRAVIRESVRKILAEANSYNQMINQTGIDDNDEWNANANGEYSENNEDEILQSISSVLCNGQNPRTCAFSFNDLTQLLAQAYGLKYMGFSKQNHCHKFNGNIGTLSVFPDTFYKNQNMMTLKNIMLV